MRGRPSPLYFAKRLGKYGMRDLSLKRGSDSHRAHKLIMRWTNLIDGEWAR